MSAPHFFLLKNSWNTKVETQLLLNNYGQLWCCRCHHKTHRPRTRQEEEAFWISLPLICLLVVFLVISQDWLESPISVLWNQNQWKIWCFRLQFCIRRKPHSQKFYFLSGNWLYRNSRKYLGCDIYFDESDVSKGTKVVQNVHP